MPDIVLPPIEAMMPPEPDPLDGKPLIQLCRVMSQVKVSTKAKIVLLCLASRAYNKNRMAFLSRTELSAWTGLSVRTVVRAFAELQQLDFLVWKRLNGSTNVVYFKPAEEWGFYVPENPFFALDGEIINRSDAAEGTRANVSSSDAKLARVKDDDPCQNGTGGVSDWHEGGDRLARDPCQCDTLRENIREKIRDKEEKGELVSESTAPTPSPSKNKTKSNSKPKAEKKNKPKRDKYAFPKPDGVPDQLWNDYLSIRKIKTKPLSETALKNLIREAEKAGMTLQEALTMCCVNGWAGFRASWQSVKETSAKARGGSQMDTTKKNYGNNDALTDELIDEVF